MLETSFNTPQAGPRVSTLTIALAGNPNAGKSTIFNALTGLHQHTGNWPGKTVEKREGACTRQGMMLNIVDLPGTYSLSAYSPEERIARDYLLSTPPTAIINVIDATNLERNLYLTVQLLELGLPVVLALNMMDEAERDGIHIDTALLSERLGGVAVIATTARTGRGLDALVAALDTASASTGRVIDYGRDIERAIAAVQDAHEPSAARARWLALKLLEDEPGIMDRVSAGPGGDGQLAIARDQAEHLRQLLGDEVDIITADRRYGAVSGLIREVVRKPALDQVSLTQRIDDIVTHRWLGLPVFFAVMYLMFRLVIDVAAPFTDWVDSVLNGPLARALRELLAFAQAPAWLSALTVDGAFGGVASVLTFVPGLMILYLFLALLEDSGYMARAAFVMDRLMRVVGLHGKAFIPMILGFGCAVPAIYATRTIASRRDRILTSLLVPLMSCSARLPVYTVFGLALFGAQAGTLVWVLYTLGIAAALVAGAVFTRTVLKPDQLSAFVLELPPYRLPTWRSVSTHMWENTREFVQKAGTTILAVSVVMWFLLNLPWGVRDARQSWFGQVSSALAPAFAPLGFGTWQASGSLLTGFVAKEVVVSTISQAYLGGEPAAEPSSTWGDALLGVATGFGDAVAAAGRTLLSLVPGVVSGPAPEAEDTALSTALRDNFSPLAATSFLVFVLLYVPCVATLGAIRHEFGARWAVFSAGYQVALAWVIALGVYQVGAILGLGQ
jgi:ferrous iron transport protein B